MKLVSLAARTLCLAVRRARGLGPDDLWHTDATRTAIRHKLLLLFVAAHVVALDILQLLVLLHHLQLLRGAVLLQLLLSEQCRVVGAAGAYDARIALGGGSGSKAG
jgi:hypothetical protein